MAEKTYAPTIKKMKVVKSIKKIKLKNGEKKYRQTIITLPKEFAEKLESEGIDSVISIADDFFIGIPPEMLLKKKRGELLAEFSDLLNWLQEHVKKIEDDKK